MFHTADIPARMTLCECRRILREAELEHPELKHNVGAFIIHSGRGQRRRRPPEKAGHPRQKQDGGQGAATHLRACETDSGRVVGVLSATSCLPRLGGGASVCALLPLSPSSFCSCPSPLRGSSREPGALSKAISPAMSATGGTSATGASALLALMLLPRLQPLAYSQKLQYTHFDVKSLRRFRV